MVVPTGDAPESIVQTLVGIQGLTVWLHASGFWTPDHGRVEKLPDGWTLVPTGDAALTRRLRLGPHWIVREKCGGYSPVVGTYAPVAEVERVRLELGGKVGAVDRDIRKQQALKLKEAQITEALRSAIRKLFPAIPEKDLKQIVSRSRDDGRVGRAQAIYFSPKTEREETMEEVAHRAVVAHVRHKYTRYEKILASGIETEVARATVANPIKQKLQSWESPSEA